MSIRQMERCALVPLSAQLRAVLVAFRRRYGRKHTSPQMRWVQLQDRPLPTKKFRSFYDANIWSNRGMRSNKDPKWIKIGFENLYLVQFTSHLDEICISQKDSVFGSRMCISLMSFLYPIFRSTARTRFGDPRIRSVPRPVWIQKRQNWHRLQGCSERITASDHKLTKMWSVLHDRAWSSNTISSPDPSMWSIFYPNVITTSDH
jgi:hypothetical protein